MCACTFLLYPPRNFVTAPPPVVATTRRARARAVRRASSTALHLFYLSFNRDKIEFDLSHAIYHYNSPLLVLSWPPRCPNPATHPC